MAERIVPDASPTLARPSAEGEAGGMMPLSEFEAQGGEQEPEAEVVEPDALLTRASDARLAELKAKARAMIEERLKAKRKQRRLMRGGEDW